MKKYLVSLLLLVMLLAGCSAVSPEQDAQETLGDGSDSNTEVADDSDLYEVVRVVDGDTIVVDYNGVEEKLRLIGVDTPESVHPDESKNTEFGNEASAYTKEKLEGQKVGLEFDVEQRDKYGRLLAYVYLDGEMFNADLVENGYAMVYTFPPNVKYADLFSEKQQLAREAGVGLWEDVLSSGEYVASLSGEKYHFSSCSSANRIKEENKIWFNDKESAEAAGYEPCSICNP